MAKVIHKYPLNYWSTTTLNLVEGTKVLKLAYQDFDTFDTAVLWVEEEKDAGQNYRLEERKFTFVGTGSEVPEQGVYIDTLVDSDRYVWHFYEVPV